MKKVHKNTPDEISARVQFSGRRKTSDLLGLGLALGLGLRLGLGMKLDSGLGLGYNKNYSFG